MRSGHAYRAAHLHHHARYPHEDDIEGEASRFSFWRTILSGPLHTPRIWLWALNNGRRYRKRISIEISLCLLLGMLAVLACRWTWVPLVYVALVVSGSWTFPLMTP
jgi:beta-carotene hydroxylase